jgi:hypothetical protein
MLISNVFVKYFKSTSLSFNHVQTLQISNFKANCVVVTAKYTTFAKHGRSKRFVSPYAMLPNVSNIDIAKSKRPIHELIVAAC